MPTYHFVCASCREEFTMHLPMGTDQKPACPTCKSTKNVEKIIKAPMVHFKGSGFYKTDSAGKGQKERKEIKENKETKETKTPEVKTEVPKPIVKASETSK